MAKFIVDKVKVGIEGNQYNTFICISSIIAEENEEVIILPSHYENEEITHLGFAQDVVPAHEHFHDYQHPSQGSEWRNTEYKFDYIYFKLPSFVKKIIIPETITQMHNLCFDKCVGLDVEFAENNPKYYCKDKNIYYKPKDYLIAKLK